MAGLSQAKRRLQRRALLAVSSLLTLIPVTIAYGAAPLPFTLPAELQTKYGPIAPLCFMNFVGEAGASKPVNLKKDACVKHQQPYNESGLEQGFLGYDVTSEEPGMRLPSVFYRYIGRIDEDAAPRYVFLVNWSGGGSGFFTDLIELQLKQDELSLIATLDGGDRCFGGVHDAVITDNVLSYQKNVTSRMVLDAGSAAEDSMLPANELQDCAVCCVGSLQVSDGQVTGLQFNGTIPNLSGDDKQQACFNDLIIQYGAESNATLDLPTLHQLQQDILSRCLSSPTDTVTE